jgi:hypothetical protein
MTFTVDLDESYQYPVINGVLHQFVSNTSQSMSEGQNYIVRSPPPQLGRGLTTASSWANLAALIRARLSLGGLVYRALLLWLEAKENWAMVRPHEILLLVTFADLDSKAQNFRVQVSLGDCMRRGDLCAAGEHDWGETH